MVMAMVFIVVFVCDGIALELILSLSLSVHFDSFSLSQFLSPQRPLAPFLIRKKAIEDQMGRLTMLQFTLNKRTLSIRIHICTHT